MTFVLSTGYAEADARLALLAKAMGHPARIAILKYLASLNTCCFGDIHKELPISKATVSQHLKALKEAGLITGSIDPPRVNYCMDKAAWEEAMLLFSTFFNPPGGCCK